MKPREAADARNCGKCNLCCKLTAIPEFNKPDNTWCEHCEVGKGCRIYEHRPQMCRAFFCGYIVNPMLDEQWNPAAAHFFLRAVGDCLIIQVDPQRPDAWKREPYHSALRNHARVIYPQGNLIFVKIGNRTIFMLPYEDVDLGHDGDAAAIRPVLTAAGARWEAVKSMMEG